MIKNIKDLSNLERKELKTLYLEYFKEYDKNNLTGIGKVMNFISLTDNSEYVRHMIEEVLNGNYVGVALLDYSETLKDEVIVGFAVGHADLEEDTAWLSHFYIDQKNSSAPNSLLYQKHLTCELYLAIAKEFQKMGKSKIATEVGKREYSYRQLVESLGFAPVYDYEDGHEDFGRTI